MNDCSDPLFSVIICTHNRAAILPRAIASVLGQTFADFELVVVDDGSTDNTAAVVAALDDPRVRYIHQEHARLSAARNTGVDNSSGRFVVFLDDDDEAVPEWLDRLRAKIDDRCAVVCCGETVLDEDRRTVKVNLPASLGPAFGHQTGLFLAGTFAVRRDAYEAAGGFDPRIERLHHTEFALRLLPTCASRGWEVGVVEQPLLRRTVRPGGRPGEVMLRSLARSAEYILTKHEEKVSSAPRLRSDFWAVAGVSAARAGDYGEARRLFRQAARARPWSLKNRLRLVISTVPPLADRVWNVHAFRAPAEETLGR